MRFLQIRSENLTKKMDAADWTNEFCKGVSRTAPIVGLHLRDSYLGSAIAKKCSRLTNADRSNDNDKRETLSEHICSTQRMPASLEKLARSNALFADIHLSITKSEILITAELPLQL